jgi:hypothetical protein
MICRGSATWPGRVLPRGSREVVLDGEGRVVRIGPVQLKKLPV